ncbi:DUF4145 domain-containing protein [Arthrobacter halodurans]|uniref:DUF4145 domain-containing protein n=1 Tax=Arthrobacter halodurans TaxID=516699 RepID=A0ABV4UPT8_9MICC
MSPFGPGAITQIRHGAYRIESAMACDQCKRLSIAGLISSERPTGTEPVYMIPFWSSNDPSAWAPLHVEGQEFVDVPAHVANAASEAYKSHSIENYMSAILMARTVVEAAAKETGVISGSLFNKIDELEKKSLIRPDTKEAAHAIRQFGNDMAHGDIAIAVDAEDSTEVLTFMSEILYELFQGPARISGLKARAAARKQAP